MYRSRRLLGCALLSATGLVVPAAAETHPLGVAEKALITRTILSGDVTGDQAKETVVLAEFMTSQKDEKSAIGILLGVYPPSDKTDPIWTRDYGAVLGGYVSRGQLSLVDLDFDGVDEIYTTMHQEEKPGIVRVIGEILRESGGQFLTAWRGPVRVDTTSPASGLPGVERERYVREIDYGKTAKTRGGMIVFKKTVFVAAGVPIDPPKIVDESFPTNTPGR